MRTLSPIRIRVGFNSGFASTRIFQFSIWPVYHAATIDRDSLGQVTVRIKYVGSFGGGGTGGAC
jgi:hypothetical protein